MTVCILGVIAFQGYWLISTYQIHELQFRRTVRTAFISAVEKQQFAEARRLMGAKLKPGEPPRRVFFRNTEPLDDEIGERVVINRRIRDGMEVRFRQEDQKGTRVMNYTVGRAPGKAGDSLLIDTLAHRLTRMLIVDWAGRHPFDLRRFDSTYRAELRLRDIREEYRLDTVFIRPGRYEMKMDSLVSAGGRIKTPPMPINPVKNQFLQATFDRPMGYVVRRMGWPLGGSVVLLALTTWCFLYMLSTILKQKKLSEIKNDFINNMTHELKTPIATVSAAVEALQHFGALDDPQKTRTYLTISGNELQRLSDLVEKVLNMAVEENRELEIHRERLQPAELLQELVGIHRLKAPKPVSIEVRAEPSQAPVEADRLHIGNAINNLIDNAIKYSRESVEIRIDSRSDERGWRLAVEDNGIGIPKNYQEAIFDRFFRVPTGNLHPVKGFGLGLSYVRQVVEKHGGRIEVTSEPGVGSRFELWIPRER